MDLARDCGRQLTVRQGDLLTAYLQLLEKWNRKMNLVGPRDWQSMLTTLVIDSWHLADFLGDFDFEDDARIVDLGAGAGLPGIPLRVFWDKGEYVLVEPRHKRALFMQTAIRTMGLAHTRVARCRVEDLASGEVPANLVLSRAFCPWRTFLDIAHPLLHKDGLCLVMANTAEPTRIPSGWRLKGSTSYGVGADERFFWMFAR